MKASRFKEYSIYLIIAGLWLIATALSFGPLNLRIFYNDIFIGILLVILGSFSFQSFHSGYFFPFGLIGLWLNFSPLFFWAPERMEYINDTIVGLLVLIFAFQFLPSLHRNEREGEDIPLGWSFNPSRFSHRVPVIFFAVTCWFLARYLDGFELGYYRTPWDPFFKNGTMTVLSSKISRSFPIPDAGLGALAYSLEAILCWQGGEARWKKNPWLVLSFGVLALPLSIVSILLILSQPLIVGAWCFLCLCIAFLMLFIVLLAFPEVIATCQLLKREHSKGRSLFQVLFFGSTERSRASQMGIKKRKTLGISLSWNQVLLLGLSILMIFYTSYRTISEPFIKSVAILAAFGVIFSTLSLAEVLKPIRFLNILIGISLCILPFVWIRSNVIDLVVSMLFGISFIVLSFYKVKIKEKYGDWDKFIF